MKIAETFLIEPEVCAYLGDRPSIIEYSVVKEMSGTEYENLMNRGWRKFGPLLFHPVCQGCQECRPIRIPVAAFVPDRSQRRNMRLNADLEVSFEPPAMDEERIALYNSYHRWRTEVRGWPLNQVTRQEYQVLAVNNPIQGRDILVRFQGHLVAVMQLDLTPRVVSDVYHFYAPALTERGLGAFLILQSVEMAKKLGKPYVYLGYHVKGSRSMEYKTRYRPYEILNVEGCWVPFGKT